MVKTLRRIDFGRAQMPFVKKKVYLNRFEKIPRCGIG
jgi:hypothetical protein